VRIPPDIGNLLDATNKALQAIPQDNFEDRRRRGGQGSRRLGTGTLSHRRRVDVTGHRGRQVGRQLGQLIDQSPPVLNSQVQTSDAIATWAARTASITGQFKAQDQAFGDLLNIGGPALGEGKALFDRVAPALPVLLGKPV